ncbi:MAG: hypothetical protein R6V76_05250, partial [Desulfobacterales bacterium]
MVIAIAIFLVVGHYAIGFVQFIMMSTIGDPREDSPVYQGYPDRIDYWKEQLYVENAKARFEPYIHWRQAEFTGKYINIDRNGIRKTIRKTNTKGKKKIFMFGGSSLWGEGSPDDSTIPSALQSMLEGKYDIYNYGESGFVSAQEMNYLLYQLSMGNIPDVVIFYDGVNDAYAGVYSPAIPRDPQNLRMEYLNKSANVIVQLIYESNYYKLAHYISRKMHGNKDGSKEWDKKISPKIKMNAKAVIKMYEAHIKQVQALANEYKFKAFFFWQPNLFCLNREKLPYEKDIINKASPVFVESQYQVYLEAKESLSKREDENVYFMGDLFNNIAGPIYIDYCHVGPRGNRLIAERIIADIGEKL